MIDKTAGLPTQIRNLEKRLKDMDASKVKPALIKEITDTIKNLKDMLKEKQEKKEQRKRDKEQAAQDVEKEAISVPNAADIGAVAPNAVAPTQVGQPEATPDDQKISCPLCGGMTFNDQASYQQHMEYTHASDIMPTTPGQKLDKTVASTDDVTKKVETDPKIAPGVIVPDSVKKHDKVVDRVEQDPKIAPHLVSEQGPQFKLDDEVKPIRGGESKGKVMRWDGKPNDLVYVMWEIGPLKDRDGFGGYYPHDLQSAVEASPVEAAMPEPEPVCEKCIEMQQKHGDLKTNYEALLKDLEDERKAHYEQGNHSWVARLDQKIEDLKKSMSEKFPEQKTADNKIMVHCKDCNKTFHTAPDSGVEQCPDCMKQPAEKIAVGGPRLIRQINKATTGHGYDATEYDLANGHFKQNIPLKINETDVRMTDPTKSQFEVKYDGMDWRMVAPQEFDQWLAQWKEINKVNSVKEGGAQNAEELTIMDHTPPRANSGPDDGGKDTHDEFQDEWAMPVTSATKINVLKREFLATPISDQKKFGGYDISQDGKKLFKINSKNSQPMNKKQLEFCAEIELTRGYKQAKLVEKIAFLDAGTKIYVVAEDKARKRVKFASIDQGLRGWIPASKIAFVAKEGDLRKHKDHIDNTFGHNGQQVLVDCPNGSGNVLWVAAGELLPINPPPATPESLNDLESNKKCPSCGGEGAQQDAEGIVTCDRCKGTGKTAGSKDQKNPINWNGKNYFGILVDMDGNIVKGYTYEQGEAGGWDLYFTPEEDAAWGHGELVYAFAGNELPKLTFQWGHVYSSKGLEGPSEEQRAAKEVELEPKIMSQVKIGTSKKADVGMFPDSYFKDLAQKERAEMFGLIDVEDWALTPEGLAAKQREMAEGHDIEGGKECSDCHGTFVGNEGETCPTCGRFAVQKEALRQALPPLILNRRTEVNADLNKVARVVHRDDGWHVLSEKGKNLGGPYKSKQEAVKRLRQVEYFKHHGSLRPFSKKAEVLTDPYADLTTHITDMRSRMTQVQDKFQNAPAIKTAAGEDAAPEMDLAALFADLTQGIDLLETKLGGEEAEKDIHKQVEELENKLWKLEESLGLTPDISEEEKAEPEHKEIVKEVEKEADTVTDETIEEVTNNPSNVLPIPVDPNNPTVAPFQNVQPTDQDNLEDPTQAPTSPLPPGQKWQWNPDVGAYVAMTDPANVGKSI